MKLWMIKSVLEINNPPNPARVRTNYVSVYWRKDIAIGAFEDDVNSSLLLDVFVLDSHQFSREFIDQPGCLLCFVSKFATHQVTLTLRSVEHDEVAGHIKSIVDSDQKLLDPLRDIKAKSRLIKILTDRGHKLEDSDPSRN